MICVTYSLTTELYTNNMDTRNSLYNGFFTILLFVGLIWLRSGVGKVLSGGFADGLGKTLEKFASNNPYGWYKDILLTQAIPRAKTIGTVVMTMEILTGLLIAAAALYLLWNINGNTSMKRLLILGLAIGFLLNLNFWLASGWTSPSADGLNSLMIVIEIIGIGVVFKNYSNLSREF